MNKMYKIWILLTLFSMTLFSTAGCVEKKAAPSPAPTPVPTTPIPAKPEPTPAAPSWKGSVTETDLVKVVNFLMNNKGKEIKLGGKKHTITGKEKLDIEITVLQCCDEGKFRKYVSTLGIVKDVKFPTFHATVPADAIQELDKNGEVTEIMFAPEVKDFWMKAIKK